MIVESFVSGEWTDIVPHPEGYAQVSLEQPGVAVARVNGREVWRMPVGWGLYLRATVINSRIVAAMQFADGECRVFDGVTNIGRGPVFGQNGVAWNGSKLYILRSPTSSDEFDVVTGKNRAFTHPPTSQGFFDPVNGPFWTDDAFTNVPGMTLGFTRGALALGQSQTALQLRLRHNGTYSIAYDGVAYEPRLVQLDPTTWIACARTPRGALTLTLTPPFPAEHTPGPLPPIPTPIPEPPNVAVQDVPNYSSLLHDVAEDNDRAWRNAHRDYEHQGQPGFTSREDAEEFIRIAAYALNTVDPRIGLNGKRASATISQDALCFRHDDGRESVIDAINGAGGSNPSIGWNVVGHYRAAGDGQKWIRPVAVPGAGQTPSRPDPPPSAPKPPTPRPSTEFPEFVIPWDIFLERFQIYRANTHERDRLSTDTITGGSMAYFMPAFINGVNGYVKRFGLPVHRGNDQDWADQWRRLTDAGITRAIDAYQHEQGKP